MWQENLGQAHFKVGHLQLLISQALHEDDASVCEDINQEGQSAGNYKEHKRISLRDIRSPYLPQESTDFSGPETDEDYCPSEKSLDQADDPEISFLRISIYHLDFSLNQNLYFPNAVRSQ